MSAVFGTIAVFVAVIEWDSERDVDILVRPTREEVAGVVRQVIVETFGDTVPEYDPDGVREFVLTPSDLPDQEWLEELHLRTTVPWVTIEEHSMEIH